MTLDEAIKMCEEKAEKLKDNIIAVFDDGREFYNSENEEEAKEYEQLAEWLTELKVIRKVVKTFIATHDEKWDCRMDMIEPFCSIINIVKENENEKDSDII